MDIKQRRWLYSIFIFLFLIISPLIIAYALGYRLDTSHWSVTKVGALYIKSYPAGANIYVNDVFTKRKTPTQVINIPVGQSTFLVEKDGYQPWSKTLEVTAGNTTFVQDILIFKQDLKKQSLGSGGSQLLASTNNDAYVYLTESQELINVNTVNRTTANITKLPATAQLQQWSPDERNIIYSVGTNWYLLSLGDKQSTLLNIKPLKTITKARAGNSSSDIWILGNQSLYRQNAASKDITLIATNVLDFTLGEDKAVILTTTGLAITDLANPLITVTPIEGTTDIRLVRIGKDFVLLSRGDQYWIWRDNKIEQRISATSVDWKKNTLLFSNGYELTSYDLGSHNVSVVDRTSTLSANVLWHPSTNYFARLQNTVLDLVELDSRGDKRHVIPVGTLNPSDTYVFDPKGEYIFILTPTENYSLQLQ